MLLKTWLLVHFRWDCKAAAAIMITGLFLKEKEALEMAQQLGAPAALPEDRSLVPSTHISL